MSPNAVPGGALAREAKLDNDSFKQIWDMLDNAYHVRTHGGRIADLNHSGKLRLARKMQKDLDSFCTELVARAKAEYEGQKSSFDQLRSDYGDSFDSITPEPAYGLDFGPQKPLKA